MSNLREELSKLLGMMRPPHAFARAQILEHMFATLDSLELACGGNVSPTLRGVAVPVALCDLISDSLCIAATIEGFDLYKGLQQAAMDRGFTFDKPRPYKIAKIDNLRPAYITSFDHQIDRDAVEKAFLLATSDYIRSGYDKLSRTITTSDRVDPSVLAYKAGGEAQHRKDLEVRDTIIEDSFKALEKWVWANRWIDVPGLHGRRDHSEVRKPKEDLPKCVATLGSRVETARNDAKNGWEANKLNIIRAVTAESKIEKCMKALETAKVGKPGEEVATCVAIADLVQSLRNSIYVDMTALAEANKTIRERDVALQTSKTQFAEYRSNVEMQPKRISELERKLAVAAMDDQIVMHLYEGKFSIVGWKIEETEAVRKLREKTLGMHFNDQTIDLIKVGLVKIMNEICPGIVKSTIELPQIRGAQITIKIDTKKRDYFAFGKGAGNGAKYVDTF